MENGKDTFTIPTGKTTGRNSEYPKKYLAREEDKMELLLSVGPQCYKKREL